MMNPAHRTRARVAAIILTFSLLAVGAGIWSTPGLHWPVPGPTAEDIALQRDEAALHDLERQNHALTDRLRSPHPMIPDRVALARATDLEDQLKTADNDLRKPHPSAPDLVDLARIRDLQRRLAADNALLRRPRPRLPDLTNLARARDLAAQNDQLEADLTRPRPTVDPLATVTAPLSRDEIAAAGHLFGLYTTQSPFDYGETDLVEADVNRRADVVGYFQSWADPYNDLPIRNAWLHGQVPLLTWESQQQVGQVVADQPAWSLPSIIAGAHDDQIHAYARGIATTRLPVILRLDHEMNGTWYPWSEQQDSTGTAVNGNHVGDYVAMWRHVHDLFQADGANAYTVWLWSPNRVNRICSQRPPADFYPGDAYVDWVGMSAYYRNYPAAVNGCDDIGPTFDAVYGRTLPLLRDAAPGRPIFLSETGAAEDGGHKVTFINSLFAGLAANPDIAGFAWFNLAVSSGQGESEVTHDWRIDSSGSSVKAMAAGLAASGFGTPP